MIYTTLSNAFLITSQFLYSERETRFNVSIDYSEFITGSEEMMRSMDKFHVNTEEVFESLSTSSVKLDATLSGSLESQIRQLENYKGVVRSVEAAISGSGEQIEEAYMDIARTAQEAARTGATRLIFDVEGAKVQVDLYKKVIDDFLGTITRLSVGVKSGSVTTKEAARGLFEFREAWQDILPSEFINQLNRTRASLIATTKDTDGAVKKITELGSAMKEVTAKDVTFRFKVMPEGLAGLAQTQEAIKGVIKQSEEVNNIRPILSGLRDNINNLPPALSGVAQGFTQVVATGEKLVNIRGAGQQLLVLMETLKTSGITSFEGISNALNQLTSSSHLAPVALQPLKKSLQDILEELAREGDIRRFGEALVSAAKQPSASMTDLEGNVKEVLDAFQDLERVEDVTDDVARLLAELGKTESVQKARQDILGFGRTLTEGAGTEEYIEKLSDMGESLAATGEDTSKFTSILNKFANANIKTAGDADKLNSEIRRTANNLSTMGEETKAAQNIDKLSESITKSKVDKFGKDITKLTDNLGLTSGSLANLRDTLVKVGNRYEGMSPSIQNINNLIGDFDAITSELVSEGLPQLASRFKGIREEAKKRLGLAYVSEELEKVNNLLSTGDLDNAELSIRDLSSATQLSGNQFKDLRSNLDMLSGSIEKQNNLIQAASEVKQIISNKSITSVSDLRDELKKARVEFENTEGLEEFNEALGEVIDTSGEFKKIEHFGKALHGLTTIETDDIDLIQSSLKDLGDEAKKDARSIEDLVEDLRKLGVSPQGLRSIEKAEESLRKVHGTARKKRVVEGYAKSVEKTADKLDKASTGAKKFTKGLGDINKNAGGMRKIFSAVDAQMSRLLIRFGVWGIARNLVREFTEVVSRATREIYTLTKEAAKLQDTSTAFRVLASQTTSAELALAQVRAAAGGVIDEFELMGSATRAAIAGLPVERIDDFMRGARALGPLVGRDIPEAFDRLTSAAIKQERRLLDELGIVIRANDAYKEYARTHDTTVDAMKATEKQMAFTEAIIASVNEKILRLGGNLDQAQRPFLRFESAWKDLRIAMGDWLNESLGVPDTLNSLTQSMRDFSFSMADASKQSAILAASTLEAYESFKRYSDEFTGSVPRLVKEAQKQIKITESQTSSLAAQYDAEERLAEIVKTLSTAFPALARILEVDVASGLRAVAEESEKLRKTFQAISVIRMAEAFKASIEAYKEAGISLAGVRKELDLLTAARNKMVEKATPGEIKAVDETTNKYKEQAKAIGMSSLAMSAIPAQQAINLSSIEANIEASTKITAAFMEEQGIMRSQTEIIESLIKSNIDLENITAENFSNIIDTIDAYEDYKITTADITLDQFLMNKELESTVASFVNLAATLGSTTDSSEDLKKGMVDLGKEFNKVGAITGLTNEELLEHHELLRIIIADIADVPPKEKDWEKAYKQFETLTKAYNKFRTQFEPTEFMIEISPSERSKIELKRMETEYKALFDLLAEGLEFTAVPRGEVNKTAAAQQMLNELLADQRTYIQQLVDGEKDLAKETLKSIDERLEVYKLDKTQVDELNILSNKQVEIKKLVSSIDKKKATERVAQSEESIAKIKEETKNQISAYKQIITEREALVSSLRSLGILSYELESQLLKKIAQDRIALQKATWADEQKRLKDAIKRQLTFANTMSGMISSVYGANKEAVIDMLGEVSAMGTEVFKLDIEPGEIAPEKLISGFEQIKDVDIPGLDGIGDKTVEVSKKVVATLADMLNAAGDTATQVTEKTIASIEDVMREYLISLHASLDEMSALDSAYLADKQAVEKALIKLAQDRIKREMSDEKARVSFLLKSEKEILNIKKSTNKVSITSRVEAIKLELNALRQSVKERQDIVQAVQDIEIAAHGQISDINHKNTRDYLQKIRITTKTEQLLKIRDEYDAEELGEINKARLRSVYADQFKGLLDKEIDVIENNINKRQGIEEAAAIARINVAREETRQRIEELLKLAKAEGKPEEVKRLQELSIASEEIAATKITGIIKEASRKRRMESLKLRKGISGDEEELARLTINAQMDSYVESNSILGDLAESQKQKHLEDISRLLEATDVNEEELAKNSASLQEVLNLEAVVKDNIANEDILRKQLVAEAIRKIREKEFNEYQAIMKSTADVLGETSKIAYEIRKNLIMHDAAEREKDLEHAKNIAIRRMQRETDILDEQLNKELEIEADFADKRKALSKATEDELLENTKDYNVTVAESHQETFNTILESFEVFANLIIHEDAEMVEARKNTQVRFWRDQLTSVRKNSDKVIQSNKDLADRLYEIDMKSSERRILVIESITSAATSAGDALVATLNLDFGTALKHLARMIQSINKIFDDASERRKEALERAKEEFKALKSEWRAAGADIGRAVGQAITDNLEVDFDALVRELMRAALAAQLGEAFAEMFGPSMKMIKDSLAGAVGKGERWDKLVEDEVSNAERWINQYEKLVFTQGKNIADALIQAEWDPGMLAKVIEPYRKGVPIEKIASDVAKSKYGLHTLGLGIKDLGTTWTELEPGARELVTAIDSISDIYKETAENIGLRTLRAITEPQANQIIVLLGRQTDHLATIASNTTTLIKQKYPEVPQVSTIEIPAPKINNDVIPNQVQLAPTFNIEPQPLPDIINKVEAPEINLAPRIINDLDIPEISVVSARLDTSNVNVVRPIDLSQRTIFQLSKLSHQIAPAITAPQIQYIETIAQPQRQPEYYPSDGLGREESTRSVLSEHKEDIKISIDINDRTVVSEDGMLVDAVLPMLMEEESRMKMRREKAIGRRVYNRGR